MSRTAILRGVLLLSQTCRPVKFRRTHRVFLQPAIPSHRVPKKPLFSPAPMSIERKTARLRLRHRRVTNLALASLSFPRPCRAQQRPATERAGSNALMGLPRRLPRMTSNGWENPIIWLRRQGQDPRILLARHSYLVRRKEHMTYGLWPIACL